MPTNENEKDFIQKLKGPIKAYRGPLRQIREPCGDHSWAQESLGLSFFVRMGISAIAYLEDDLDLRTIPRRNLMKDVTLIDEPTCVADIDSLIAEWVRQHYGSLGASLLPEYARNRRSIIKWTWLDLPGPDRPWDSASVDNRVGLIGFLRRIIGKRFSRTKRLRQSVERCLGDHDGRRLPVPLAIRGNCRKVHEAQTTAGESGGDDD